MRWGRMVGSNAMVAIDPNLTRRIGQHVEGVELNVNAGVETTCLGTHTVGVLRPNPAQYMIGNDDAHGIDTHQAVGEPNGISDGIGIGREFAVRNTVTQGKDETLSSFRVPSCV